MNHLRKSLSTGLIAAALAASGLLVTAVTVHTASTVSSNTARLGPGSVAGEGAFVATTARCHVEDVHAWAYPSGYLRGQTVVCDILSNEPRIQGRITLQHVCPINGTTRCNATFRIDADSGARWEGAYWTEWVDGNMGLLGVGLGDGAGAQIVLDIYHLKSVNGWRGNNVSDDVVGRITVTD